MRVESKMIENCPYNVLFNPTSKFKKKFIPFFDHHTVLFDDAQLHKLLYANRSEIGQIRHNIIVVSMSIYLAEESNRPGRRTRVRDSGRYGTRREGHGGKARERELC